MTEENDIQVVLVDTQSIVTVEGETISIVTQGQQGPAGAQGPIGPAGPVGSMNNLNYTASQPVSGHKVVYIDTLGGFSYASSDNLSCVGRIVGLTTNAASAGDNVQVVCLGEVIEPSWSLDIGNPVYLGVNGAITQTQPTSGFSQIIGFPLSSNKLYVKLQEPLVSPSFSSQNYIVANDTVISAIDKLDAAVKTVSDGIGAAAGMQFKGKVLIASGFTNIPSFTPGTDAVMDNGVIVGDGQRVLFVMLANQSLCDVYTYSVSSGTFTRTSPISSVGSMVICQTGDYDNTTLILTDSGWQWVPNKAEGMVSYLENFIGAGYYWDDGNPGNPPYFSSQNYIAANDTVISAIDRLDAAVKTVSDGIDAAVAAGLSPISSISDEVSNFQAQLNAVAGFASLLREEIRSNYSISSAGNLENGATATLINSYVGGEGIEGNAVYYNQILSGASKAQVFYCSGTNSVAFELMIVTADTGSGLSIDYTQYGLVKTGSDLNVTYDVTTATSENPQDAGAIALAITITNNSGAALDNVRVSFSTL